MILFLMSQISVKNLSKTFTYTKGNIFHKEKKDIKAVDNISFNVEKGETLAFIGPNGAGKSTTIKMLTGILYPTSGTAQVEGYNPWKKREQLAFNIGTVFGQRTQLSYHLPAMESFKLFSKIYEVEESDFQSRLGVLIDIFHLEDIKDQPLRKLSLGQRMRCEVAASLLHNPKVIFLDEPTIGLDVIAKRELRDILNSLNKELQTTIFLTSHDTSDIEAVCDRTIIINHGRIVFDNETKSLRQKYIKEKKVYIRFEKRTNFNQYEGIEVINKKPLEVNIKVDTSIMPIKKLLHNINKDYDIVDINIEDPSLESIIARLYQQDDDKD